MELNTSTIRCLGYSVYNGNLSDIFNFDKVIINTLNQYSYCIAERDPHFKKSLNNSDILLPDGIGIVKAAKFLYGEKFKKIAGADLHCYVLKELNNKGGTCLYLGSSEETLHKIEKRILGEFPNIKVATYSPPFKAEFSKVENKRIIKAVNLVKPDVLFVGMTAPKQEKWVESQKEFLNVKMICSIGAVFDFYAGTRKRPGKLWIKFGLEWLGRLLKEPSRMSKRYLYYGFVFGFYLLKEKTVYLFKKGN